MEKDTRTLIFLFSRYALLLLLASGNLFLFYAAITPLTFHVSSAVIDVFYPYAIAVPQSAQIWIGSDVIELVEACVAGSAYFLLVLLNLSTPMPLIKRVKSLAFLLGAFFILNIIRILVFTLLYVENFSFFDISHRLVWYFGSTLFIIILWFIHVRLFAIKDIPGYTDVLSIYAMAHKSRNVKRTVKQPRRKKRRRWTS